MQPMSIPNEAPHVNKAGVVLDDSFTYHKYIKYRFAIVISLFEIAIIVLFAFFVDYGDSVFPSSNASQDHETTEDLQTYYPIFQDVHVMMFIGFGFLMTFLKTHSWSAVGFNFLIGAFVIQIAILCRGLWENVFMNEWPRISLTIETLISTDYAIAAVLISFGGVLGKVNALQMLFLATIEIFFYALNEGICYRVFQIADAGGSIVIHTFGAYFGLACSYVLSSHKVRGHPNNESNYISNIFAMIGTIFLWMFWPSFNAGLLSGNAQERAIINTYLSLTGSCVTTFIVSSIYREGKFNMEDIVNASLAGGVMIGASADTIIVPFEALLVGCVAGIVSVWGFERLQPFLAEKLGLYDTCGIHNLHAMPGFIGGIISVFFVASLDVYNTDLAHATPALPTDRTGRSQAGYQFAGLFTTFGIAIITGLITGKILKNHFFYPPSQLFHDSPFWVMEDHEDHDIEMVNKQVYNTDTNKTENISTFKPNAIQYRQETETGRAFLQLNTEGPDDNTMQRSTIPATGTHMNQQRRNEGSEEITRKDSKHNRSKTDEFFDIDKEIELRKKKAENALNKTDSKH